MIDGADIIFMPYNYIVSENITNSSYGKTKKKIDLSGGPAALNEIYD